MPLSEVQTRAFAKWLRSREDFNDRADFIWDNLTEQQQTGLVNRVKSDLNTDYNDYLVAISGSYNDLTGQL